MAFWHSQPALLLGACLGAALSVCHPQTAQATVKPADLIQAAERACLQQAGRLGYRPDLSQVSSSQALGGDRVRVVLSLSRDGGAGRATLTCPFSVARGDAVLLEGRQAPGTEKQSPYAAAKDETTGVPAPELSQTGRSVEPLSGSPVGSPAKESPYAAAKDESNPVKEPTLEKLWGLLLPVGLAAVSYSWLRRREQGQSPGD